nr:RNA polymerase II subunit F [Cryptomonas curvata]
MYLNNYLNRQMYNLNNFNENEIFPLFTSEIPGLLKRRNITIEDITNKTSSLKEPNNIIYNKTLEYVNIFSKLGKEKVIILRKIITKKISKTPTEFNKNLEIQFIVCKIIDLMPISFEEVVILVPNFVALFGLKDGKSLINTIFYIIKN